MLLMANDWEIKAEPIVVWVNVYNGESAIAGEAFLTEDAAWKRASDSKPRKFVEVIE